MSQHLGCLLPGIFVTGVILGATAMFYLVRLEIVLPAFSPLPLLGCWAFVVLAWLIGRAAGVGEHDHERDGPTAPHE